MIEFSVNNIQIILYFKLRRVRNVSYNNRIRRVDPDGIITTIAGTGEYGYSGDGGPATQAKMGYSTGIAIGPDGRIFLQID